MRGKSWVWLGLAVALSGCMPQAGAPPQEPGAQVFAFRSAYSPDVLRYSCAPEGPGGAIDARAQAAHRYFDREVERFVEGQADQMIKAMDSGVSEAAFNRKMDEASAAFAARVGPEMDRRFACAYLDDQ